MKLAAGEKVHTFCPVITSLVTYSPARKKTTIGMNFVSFVLLDRRQKADFQRMGYEKLFLPKKENLFMINYDILNETNFVNTLLHMSHNRSVNLINK